MGSNVMLNRDDQFFFKATCPGQVTYKNLLVLINFDLVLTGLAISNIPFYPESAFL